MAGVANASHHPLNVWIYGMVEPRVMPMYEGLRSSNPGDEEEQEQEGVHDDRPAMDAIGDEICKKP